MTLRLNRFGWLLALAALKLGCGGDDGGAAAPASPGCKGDADCQPGQLCLQGACVAGNVSAAGGQGGTAGAVGQGGASGQGGAASNLCDTAGVTDPCSKCGLELCCAETSACLSSDACFSLLDCVGNCSTDACIQECAKTYPTGVDPFVAMIECNQQECASACGTGGTGGTSVAGAGGAAGQGGSSPCTKNGQKASSASQCCSKEQDVFSYCCSGKTCCGPKNHSKATPDGKCSCEDGYVWASADESDLTCVPDGAGGSAGKENTAALCQDGKDNDGDPYIDCDDFDCCDLVNCKTIAPTSSCATKAAGGAGGAGGSASACNAPAVSPSGGSCFTVGAGKPCNPVTNQGCNTAAGEACDLSNNGTFQCFPAPNVQNICEACDVSAGPFCKGGMTCADSKCAKYCCNDGDCGGGVCDTAFLGVAGLGVCFDGTGAAGSGGSAGGANAAPHLVTCTYTGQKRPVWCACDPKDNNTGKTTVEGSCKKDPTFTPMSCCQSAGYPDTGSCACYFSQPWKCLAFFGQECSCNHFWDKDSLKYETKICNNVPEPDGTPWRCCLGSGSCKCELNGAACKSNETEVANCADPAALGIQNFNGCPAGQSLVTACGATPGGSGSLCDPSVCTGFGGPGYYCPQYCDGDICVEGECSYF